jgi:anti-sigma regulatory factor (Ser/Thr protein kinase)
MAELRPNVRLNLASTPENVVLVRGMLSGVAEAVSIDDSDLNDIRIAVTEACNNVVLHAYDGQAGLLDVEVSIGRSALTVVVRDHGGGISRPSEVLSETSAGIGLHVIRTLTHHIQFKDVPGGGTEIRMEFATPGSAPVKSLPVGEQHLPTLALAGPPSTTLVNIAPIGLARTVLPRMVSALAARAHFSTDRISDVQLLADALVAHAHQAISGDHLSIGVNVEPRDLELRIAPLEVGRAQGLISESEIEGLGAVIEKLADRHGVATAGSYETLTLSLIDRR